ncbi:MAG: family 16 glycosylhydrolase, partial [Anaerolineae bacterium]
MTERKPWILFIILLGAVLFSFASAPIQAQTTLPATVIDDFNDGDSSDWGFFGGNAAGGGGGAAADRPQEGTHYLSTGWGGAGTASGFYGGGFKNFDDAGQVVLPADPWFNVWVYNQSDATSDGYTLEITIREDLDGNGWTDTAEDSFRLDTVFTSADYNDEWTLISAPVSSFANLNTGGDGTFDGNLDEIVIVIAGVTGGDPSTVELDFDQFSFTSGGPIVSPEPTVAVIDDFNDGDSSDWGFFGGNAAGGGGGAEADRPQEGTHYLSTGWGGQGTASDFYGGGFKNFDNAGQVVLPADAWFNVWVYNQSNATSDGYRLEITIREDLDGNGWTDTAEDSFRLDTVFTSADYNDEWTLISAPVSDFANLNTGGDGTFDGNLDEIVIVIAGVTGGDPSTVEVDFDQFVFTSGGPLVPVDPEPTTQIVDDFENGLPTGSDTDGVPIGFFVVADGGSTSSIDTTDTPPAAVPDSAAGNSVMAFTADVTAFAVFIHSFENPAVDTWVTQDWSSFGGLRFWFYGQNTGTTIFVDAIDNRNPDSTTDDAERFSVTFADNFSGWQLVELPFSTFDRKEIGNGAPNDGFNLTQVHGWALGALETSGEQTFYVDDAELYGEAVIPDLSVTFASARFDIEEGTTGDVTVKLNRSLNSDDPAEVSVDYATFPGVATPGREYTPASGTLTFVNGGPSELTFSIETFDDTKWEGDERIGLSLTNPVNVATGFATQASAFIMENDVLDPNLIEDFSYGAFLWDGDGVIETKEIESGDADAIPGQDAFETVLNFSPAGSASPQDTIAQVALDLETLLPANTNFLNANIINAIHNVNQSAADANWEDGYFLDSNKGFKVFDSSAKAVQALKRVVKNRRASAELKASAQEAIDTLLAANVVVANLALDLAIENDGNSNSIASAERYKRQADRSAARGNIPIAMNKYGWMWVHATRSIKNIDVELPQLGQAALSREFPDAEDWSAAESMSFWYYGQNSGDAVTVELLDNRAADPGPSGWEMVWAEEFNEPAGTTPNPEYWTYEIGDVTPDGKNGWGNDERQYYTDDPANAATDGEGNMVLTVREDESGRDCYYGECEYTSARLISWRKAEFAYGRIESRIKVPPGEGIWPAFWSLGTDIDVVSWPQTGEIDFMEFVGRLPNEIFGTIHGPGYAGGASFGNIYTFDEPVYEDYHTFTVEWEPDLIKWYVDGILYHTATPDDVAPNEWVFNDEVFLLLNVA